MSYAIVRNEKLTRAEINGKGTHNDRKAKNHSNKELDQTLYNNMQNLKNILEGFFKNKIRLNVSCLN